MCEPTTTMMAGATLLQLGGAGISAAASKKAGDYNAGIARGNAAIQRKLSKDAIKRGDKEEAQFRLKTGGFKSDQITRMLAGGGTLTGSNSKILDDTDTFGELDALMIRSNARKEAYGHKVNAFGLDQQARLSEMGGNADAFATIMGSGVNVANSWLSFSQPAK